MAKIAPGEQLMEIEYLEPSDEDLRVLLLAPVILHDTPVRPRARRGRMVKVCAHCGRRNGVCSPVEFFEFTEE